MILVRHAGDGLDENPFKLVNTAVPFTTNEPDIYHLMKNVTKDIFIE